ncbi:MAG: ATP-dependent Clp protease adaptor ClpS [Sutterella sp.]|nr:ATP-dependent Clp protease adaptor ClpS [Sutterella sp.]
MPGESRSTHSQVATLVQEKEDQLWAVVFFNDDVTPFEWVRQLLISLFKHTESAAQAITLRVHNEGQGVAGRYPKAKAILLASKAMMLSQSNGFPLVCKAMPDVRDSQE